MKAHINVLYGIVVVLLILQFVSFLTISSQISKVVSSQDLMEDDIKAYVSDLENKIDTTRQENMFAVSELTAVVAEQRKNVETQINLLKSSQEDFSGIIEEVIESVVSVRTDRSAGSGFIVDSRGYLVTNSHVIQGANFVMVQTFDGEEYGASVVGLDAFTDLALLKIDGFFESINFADSDDVQIGEKVIAIGNPLGLSFTVTEGIVSAKERRGPNGLEAYIQTDVTLNPGNSGGPLISKEGKVIGINNFKIGGLNTEGLGFALESDVVKETVNLIANKTIIN